METSMFIYIVVMVLVVLTALAGIYFLIYQKHINKTLNDPEYAKKKHIRLPSIATSYTGMWFIIWIVSVIITLMLIMDGLRHENLIYSYSQSTAEQINYMQDEIHENKKALASLREQIMNQGYVNENNTTFSLGDFDPDSNTIALQAVVSIPSMTKDDTITWRMNSYTTEMTPDLKNKTFTGTVKINITDFDEGYMLDSVFISDINGVKLADRICKNNYYYTDNYYGWENEDYENGHHFLPKGDFAVYWGGFFPSAEAYFAYNDGYNISFESENNSTLKIDEDLYIGCTPAENVSQRKMTSGKIVVYIDGKNAFETPVDMDKANVPAEDNNYYIHITKAFENLKSNSTIDIVFETTDNYGYSYSTPIWNTWDTGLVFNTSKVFEMKDKNGNIIVSKNPKDLG